MSDFDYVFRREHPEYQRRRTFWERAAKAYSGGADYIRAALIKHVSEVEPEFQERLRRACYFNYPRKIARIIAQYVLSEEPRRENADPALLEDFSYSGLRANEVMRQFATYLNVFGVAWTLVDMPAFPDAPLDLDAKRRRGIRPYARNLNPLYVPDWAFGSDGRLLWAVVQESCCDNADPFAPPVWTERRRLWTRDEWLLFSRGGGRPVLESKGRHGLGMVPLIRCEEADGFGMAANHWFEDAVRISDAILNAESEAQMNIIKQMFGLLVVSEAFAAGGGATGDGREDAAAPQEKFSHVIARTAAVWETAEEKGITRYISPGGAETGVIRAEIGNLKKELFDVVGLAVQRESKTEQTAESKAWDQQNVAQFLRTRADQLEQAEQEIWALMHVWDHSVTVPELSYNREFSVIDLRESVQTLLDFEKIAVGEEYRRTLSRAAVKLLNRIYRIPAAAQRTIEQQLAVAAAQKS